MTADVLIALLLWVAAGYLFLPRNLLRPEGRTVLAWLFRGFVLSIVLAATFAVEPWVLMFDHAVGLNNLSWLLVCLFYVAGLYLALLCLSQVSHFPVSIRPLCYAVSAALLLLLVYPPLAKESIHFYNFSTWTPGLLPVRAIRIVYDWLMYTELLGVLYRMLSKEQQLTGRLRIHLGMVSLRIGQLNLILQAFGALLFVFQLTPLLTVFGNVSNAIDLISDIPIIIAFMPLKGMQLVARLWIYIEQQMAVRELTRLRRELVAITALLPWPIASPRERFFQPSYALYCLVIDILDRRTLLQSLIQNHDVVTPESKVIQALMAELPPTEDWTIVMQHMRQVIRNLGSRSSLQMQAN